MAITDAGENQAWELLATRDPAGVCARAAVTFDPDGGAYRVPCLGRSFSVKPDGRLILNLEPEGEVFLKRFGYFFRLSVLRYLVKAAPVRPSGNLVKPSGLPSGDRFFTGAHELPLDALAARYATRPEAFLAAGAALGGTPAPYGDAAVVLAPLPKIPTTVILWTADDEFPARAGLLFDTTAPQHLPLDILWSTAMLSLLPFLEHAAFGRP
jgi:hypothetical protein